MDANTAATRAAALNPGVGASPAADEGAPLVPCAAGSLCVIRLRAPNNAGAGAFSNEHRATSAGCTHVGVASSAASVGSAARAGGARGAASSAAGIGSATGAGGARGAASSAAGIGSAAGAGASDDPSELVRLAKVTASLNKLSVRVADKVWAMRMMGLADSGLALHRLTAQDIKTLVSSKALEHENGFVATAAAAKKGILIFPGNASTLLERIKLYDSAHAQIMSAGFKEMRKPLLKNAEPPAEQVRDLYFCT